MHIRSFALLFFSSAQAAPVIETMQDCFCTAVPLVTHAVHSSIWQRVPAVYDEVLLC